MFDTEIRRRVDDLEAVIRSVDPASVSGAEARSISEQLARAERLCSANFARFAARVSATNSFAVDGARNPAEWAARLTGTDAPKARKRLEAAEALSASAVASRAFDAGELSGDQAQVIAPVAGLSERAGAQMVELARSGAPMSELRAKAELLSAQHRSEQQEADRDARQHRQRSLRMWRGSDGGLNGQFFLPDAAAALFKNRLDIRFSHLVINARRTGCTDTPEQLRADALVSLICGAERTEEDGTDTQVIIGVSATALKRGALGPGEHCEINGLGQVSIATVRSLMEDSLYSVLVTDAKDVYAITSPKHDVPTRLRHALMARDQRCCVVPNCDISYGLHAHHLEFWTLGGKTELKNLGLICRLHHAMIHNQGFTLSGGPGKWVWHLPPPGWKPPPKHWAKKPEGSTPSQVAMKLHDDVAFTTKRRAVTAKVTTNVGARSRPPSPPGTTRPRRIRR